MEDWQLRVINEKDELFYNVTKLHEFLKTDTYKELSSYDKNLLLGQANAMSTYLCFLNLRISRFQDNE